MKRENNNNSAFTKFAKPLWERKDSVLHFFCETHYLSHIYRLSKCHNTQLEDNGLIVNNTTDLVNKFF